MPSSTGKSTQNATDRRRMLAGLLLLASTAFTAEHPMLTAGFAPGTIQQGDRYGAVNVLNGALTLPISLGPRYKVDEGLSYGLSLTYSSSYRSWVGKPEVGHFQTVRGRSSVGWGWVMHMGRIGEARSAPDAGAVSGGSFQAPDGSWHKLYLVSGAGECGTAYPTCYVTRDGSFIRAVYSSSAAPTPVLGGATWRVWTPDGVEREMKHILPRGWICTAGEPASHCQAMDDFAGWYTTKILSPNGISPNVGESVNVEYDATRPHSILKVWDSVRGQSAPTIAVSSDWSGFAGPPDVPERVAAGGGLVRRITFATANSSGGSSVYDLSYDAVPPLPETCYFGSTAWAGLNIPLLHKIELHEGSESSAILTTTEIEYDTTDPGPPNPPFPGHVPVRVSTYQNGSLADVLSARYDWNCVDYTEREDPDCHQTSTCFCLSDVGRSVLGVYRKCNDLHDGGEDCWDYERTLQLPAPADCDPDLFPCGCTVDPPHGCVYETNPWRVSVDLPAQPSASPPGWHRNREIHYFTSGCSPGKLHPNYPNGIERRVELIGVDGTGGPKTWLTTKTDYDWDNFPSFGREQYNLRPKRELTIYDNGNTTERDHAVWDGAGHYQFAQERTTEGCLGGPCEIARSRREVYEVTADDRNEWFLGRRKSLEVFSTWDGLSGLSSFHEFNWDQFGRLWTETRHGLGVWPDVKPDVKLYHGWVGNQVKCELFCGGDGPGCPVFVSDDRLLNCDNVSCNPSPSASNYTSVQNYWNGAVVQKGYKGQLWWSQNREISPSGLPTRDWDPDQVPRYSRSMSYDAAERTKNVRFLDNSSDDERNLALGWLAIDTLYWQRPGASETRGIIKYDAYGRQRQTTIARPWSMSMSDVDFAKDMGYDFAGNKVYDGDWCNLTAWQLDTCPLDTGRTEFFDYDPLGRAGLIRHSPSNEVLSSFTYDGMTTQRTTIKWTKTGFQDAKVDLIQDGFGRLVKVVERYYNSSATRETVYRYDALDRLVQVDMSDGSTAQVARTFTYDGLGNLRSATEPESGLVLFDRYDARGHLLQSTNARGTTVTQAYDCSERLLTSTAALPSSGGVSVKRYTYDDVGRGHRLWKDEYQNLSGAVVERAYSYLGRMGRWSETFTHIAGSGYLEYLLYYNDLGLPQEWWYPSSGTGGGLNVVYTYDRGFLQTETKLTGEPMVTGVSYDPSGARQRIDLAPEGGNPTAIFSDRQYDGRNRLQSITTSPGAYSSGNYVYDPSGNIRQIGAADGFTYDLQDQLTTASVSGVPFEYFYDGFGNLTSSTGSEPISAPVDSTTNRLIELPNGYQYLATGSLSDAPGGVSFEYDGFERMVRANTQSGTTDYLYDADGSRVASAGGNGCSRGRHSLRSRDGRLMSEFGCGGWIRDYVYAGGELVGAVQNASGRKPQLWAYLDTCPSVPLIRFVVGAHDACDPASIQIFRREFNGCYDFREPIQSTTEGPLCPARWSPPGWSCSPGTDCAQFCFVARLVTASGELGPPSKEICPGQEPLVDIDCNEGYITACTEQGGPGYPKKVEAQFTRYFLSDHLGTPRSIVRADDGQVADTMQLGPFGERLDPPTCAQRRQFTGHERDDETGLDYMMARYYGRGIGRFLSVDPLMNSAHPTDPQSWNRYAYAGNNPLRFRDPLGLFKWANECKAGDANCGAQQQWFRDSVAKLKESAKALQAGSAERKKLESVIKKIGEEGKGGLKVAFGPLDGDLGFAKGSTVTFDLAAIGSSASSRSLSSSEGAALAAGVVGHEVEHAGSGPFGVKFLTMSTERTALRTESFVYQGLSNTDKVFGLWNQSWAAVDRAKIGELREAAIEVELARQKEKR